MFFINNFHTLNLLYDDDSQKFDDLTGRYKIYANSTEALNVSNDDVKQHLTMFVNEYPDDLIDTEESEEASNTAFTTESRSDSFTIESAIDPSTSESIDDLLPEESSVQESPLSDLHGPTENKGDDFVDFIPMYDESEESADETMKLVNEQQRYATNEIPQAVENLNIVVNKIDEENKLDSEIFKKAEKSEHNDEL